MSVSRRGQSWAASAALLLLASLLLAGSVDARKSAAGNNKCARSHHSTPSLCTASPGFRRRTLACVSIALGFSKRTCPSPPTFVIRPGAHPLLAPTQAPPHHQPPERNYKIHALFVFLSAVRQRMLTRDLLLIPPLPLSLFPHSNPRRRRRYLSNHRRSARRHLIERRQTQDGFNLLGQGTEDMGTGTFAVDGKGARPPHLTLHTP